MLLEEGLCCDQCVLLAKLSAFALLHFVLQGETCLLFQVSLDFLFLHSSPCWWKGHLFLVLILGGLVDLHWICQFQLLSICGRGIDLDYCDIEWLALETNQDNNSVIFKIAPKYCISDSFVDYEDYSISCKGFLSTVVDIMVFWIKFTLSIHFNSLIPVMLMFMLAISCLTMSNLPCLMDLTLQVPMQYYFLQHWTSLSLADTSNTVFSTLAQLLRSLWSY